VQLPDPAEAARRILLELGEALSSHRCATDVGLSAAVLCHAVFVLLTSASWLISTRAAALLTCC
jgi:hypothetical protein